MFCVEYLENGAIFGQLHALSAAVLKYLQKVNVKVHTLDIAPLRSESPLQKRSGMARDLKGFHSFTCTPTRSSAIGMSHIPAFAFPAITDTHYRPRRDARLSRPWCEVAQAEIRTRNLPIANLALYHTATSAPRGVFLAKKDKSEDYQNCWVLHCVRES